MTVDEVFGLLEAGVGPPSIFDHLADQGLSNAVRRPANFRTFWHVGNSTTLVIKACLGEGGGMDIAYIHYVARSEVLRAPHAPSLPRLDEHGEPVEPATPEAEDEDAGREEDEHLNPLERLWRKIERLEARLDQLEGDASVEE
jgi:hypothetical protein